MKLKRYWLPAALFGALVVSLSMTLLMVGARSPYTHNNLNLAYSSDYNRTTQTIVGQPQPEERASLVGVQASSGDLLKDGQSLFFRLGCASCHGLTGQGGVFGPIIAGSDPGTLATYTSKGPAGMPVFAGLTEEDLKALAAYLAAATKPPESK